MLAVMQSDSPAPDRRACGRTGGQVVKVAAFLHSRLIAFYSRAMRITICSTP
jgi:hypothetical protein